MKAPGGIILCCLSTYILYRFSVCKFVPYDSLIQLKNPENVNFPYDSLIQLKNPENVNYKLNPRRHKKRHIVLLNIYSSE